MSSICRIVLLYNIEPLKYPFCCLSLNIYIVYFPLKVDLINSCLNNIVIENIVLKKLATFLFIYLFINLVPVLILSKY